MGTCIGVHFLVRRVRPRTGCGTRRASAPVAFNADGLELFRPFDGGCLKHAEGTSFGSLKSRPNRDLDVVAEPRQHSDKLIE
jgi:hypothetical protein